MNTLKKLKENEALENKKQSRTQIGNNKQTIYSGSQGAEVVLYVYINNIFGNFKYLEYFLNELIKRSGLTCYRKSSI